jgi:hypothetical protein
MRPLARLCFAVPTLLVGQLGLSQVLVDKPVMLEGANDASRQVSGLRNADSEGDALNARSLQYGAYQYAEVLGGDEWLAAFSPSTSSLFTGMRLILRVQNGSTGPATLNVDGLGAVPVRKDGSRPLEAGDIAPGETVSLVFDGGVFQLISSRRMDRKPCPPGTAAVGELYCIELQEHDSTDYPTAAIICGSQNMQLCSWAQWYVGCTRATELGLQNMIGNWEWTNSPANSDIQARVVGQSSCTQAATTNGWDLVGRWFHCCYRR